jgi:hypothetical protein
MQSTLTFALIACIAILPACSTDTQPTGPAETQAPAWYEDADVDGFGNAEVTVSAIEAPDGYVADAGDCDDSDKLIHPGASETPFNGIDENCDGSDLLALYPDSDDDGYGDEKASPVFGGVVAAGYIDNGRDCDDGNAAVNPAASEIDGNRIDDNCDGIYNDPLVTWYADVDGDGFGNPATTQQAAAAPPAYVRNSDDCNDNNAFIHPDAYELAGNGVDENCDGVDLYALYPDSDGDGYGDRTSTAVVSPVLLAGHVENHRDCDDSLAEVSPEGTEQNDTHDNDCDGVVNDGPFVVGDYGPAGGIVFLIDGTSGLSFEAAPEDQSTGVVWGCYGTNLTGAGGSAIGTGAQNTADILAGCASMNIAARRAAEYNLNGYDDWFLPSIKELAALYAQKAIVGNLANSYYWSSTESHANYVACKHFGTGLEQTSLKRTYTWPVRAIRAF